MLPMIVGIKLNSVFGIYAPVRILLLNHKRAAGDTPPNGSRQVNQVMYLPIMSAKCFLRSAEITFGSVTIAFCKALEQAHILVSGRRVIASFTILLDNSMLDFRVAIIMSTVTGVSSSCQAS